MDRFNIGVAKRSFSASNFLVVSSSLVAIARCGQEDRGCYWRDEPTGWLHSVQAAREIMECFRTFWEGPIISTHARETRLWHPIINMARGKMKVMKQFNWIKFPLERAYFSMFRRKDSRLSLITLRNRFFEKRWNCFTG